MFRKQSAAALAALLAVGACAPRALAQSGRRLPRSAVEKEFIVLTDGKPGAAKPGAAKEVRPRRVRDKGFDVRSLNARRPAPVVYAEDARGCRSTKCRVAVGALFTYLGLGMVLLLMNDKP